MAIHHKTALCLGVVSLLALSTNATTVQADSMDETMLANPCAGCHGTDGESLGGMPSIKGKSSGFIIQALKDFRDGNRRATVMDRIAKGYTDDQIKLLADYYSSRK
jgi:sulfide dehydrogenase cytochrome subunit